VPTSSSSAPVWAGWSWHTISPAPGDVVVIDAAEEVGGLLRRGTLAGVDIDLGAESFATRTDAVAALVADAGLPLELVAPRPQGAWLAVATDDGVRRARLPRRTVLGIPADPEADDVVAIIGADGAAARATSDGCPPSPTPSRRCTTWSPNVSVPRRRSARRHALPERLLATRRRGRVVAAAPGLWREFVSAARFSRPRTRSRPGSAGAAVGGIAGHVAPSDPRSLRPRGPRCEDPHRGRGALCARCRDGHRRDGERVLSARHVVIATGPRRRRAFYERAQAFRRAPRRRSASSPRRSHRPRRRTRRLGVIVDAALPSAAKALTHITAKWDWARAADARRHPPRAALRARRRRRGSARPPTSPARSRSSPASTWPPPTSSMSSCRSGRMPSPGAAPDDLPAGIHHTGAAVAGTGLASVLPHARASPPSRRALAHPPVVLPPHHPVSKSTA
jgi:oxygen-dependent protoporphyrinogen oxidase